MLHIPHRTLVWLDTTHNSSQSWRSQIVGGMGDVHIFLLHDTSRKYFVVRTIALHSVAWVFVMAMRDIWPPNDCKTPIFFDILKYDPYWRIFFERKFILTSSLPNSPCKVGRCPSPFKPYQRFHIIENIYHCMMSNLCWLPLVGLPENHLCV